MGAVGGTNRGGAGGSVDGGAPPALFTAPNMSVNDGPALWCEEAAADGTTVGAVGATVGGAAFTVGWVTGGAAPRDATGGGGAKSAVKLGSAGG